MFFTSRLEPWQLAFVPFSASWSDSGGHILDTQKTMPREEASSRSNIFLIADLKSITICACELKYSKARKAVLCICVEGCIVQQGGRLYRTAGWKAVVCICVEGCIVQQRGRLYCTAGWKAVLCICVEGCIVQQRGRLYCAFISRNMMLVVVDAGIYTCGNRVILICKTIFRSEDLSVSSRSKWLMCRTH